MDDNYLASEAAIPNKVLNNLNFSIYFCIIFTSTVFLHIKCLIKTSFSYPNL